MNTNEIVRALREQAAEYDRRGYSGEASERYEIIDLIESLQARADQAALNYQQKCRDVAELEAQLAEATQLALEVTNKYEASVKMHKITADLLAASQQRERAAVEGLTRMANCYKDCGGCVYIGDSIGKCEYDHAGNCYEWRGPQAGEGERDG